MSISKKWNWEENKEDIWLKPSVESHYYGNIWQSKGFNNILDLGCGMGRHAILFAKMNFNVDAFDLSEYAINYLKVWAQEEKVKVNTKTDKKDIVLFSYFKFFLFKMNKSFNNQKKHF